MPFGKADMVLTVDESGIAESEIQLATYLHNFSMKCDPNASWFFSILDDDDYPIMNADGPLEGPQGVNVERRIQNFKIRLTGTTPGTYYLRAGIES